MEVQRREKRKGRKDEKKGGGVVGGRGRKMKGRNERNESIFVLIPNFTYCKNIFLEPVLHGG